MQVINHGNSLPKEVVNSSLRGVFLGGIGDVSKIYDLVHPQFIGLDYCLLYSREEYFPPLKELLSKILWIVLCRR